SADSATPIRGLHFSGDRKSLYSAHADGTVRSWDVETGPKRTNPTRDVWVAHATRSPDGRLVVTAGHDGRIDIWDAATGQPLRGWVAHKSPAWLLTVTGDDLITAAGSAEIESWDLATGRRRGRETVTASHLVMSADGSTRVLVDPTVH